MKLEDISQDQINYLKNNKNEITFELLETLRSFGNEGKQLCLDILETDKNEEGYYLDYFGNKISYNGDRGLKKPYTRMNLSQIHLDEIKRCKDDVHYFKDNYVKITTKKGVNFPDIREYQNQLLDVLSDKNEEYPGQNESVVGLLSRQSGKSISTGIYLAWNFNFKTDMIIGITANKSSLAREFLNNVKNILINLPMWMQQGIKVWNKGSIMNELNMRILTDAPSSGSFRGFTCLSGDHLVEVYDKIDNCYKKISIKDLYNSMVEL